MVFLRGTILSVYNMLRPVGFLRLSWTIDAGTRLVAERQGCALSTVK